MVKSLWGWVLAHILKPLALYSRRYGGNRDVPLGLRPFVYRTPSHVNFNFGWFLSYNLILTSLMVGFLKLILPGQFQAAWYEYVLWFLGLELLMAEFEWFFHRYVLHRVTWKMFASFKQKHTDHHDLTPVPKKDHAYPIEYAEQIRSATFPAYAILVFWGVLSLVFIPLQMIFRSQPVMICGLIAVSVSFMLYEVKHAMEHLPYEKFWKKRVERSRFWKRYYCFHLIHHRFYLFNLAIGGYLGIPLDKLMGTYYVPVDSLPTEELPTLEGIRIPPPPRIAKGPVAFLDRLLVPKHS